MIAAAFAIAFIAPLKDAIDEAPPTADPSDPSVIKKYELPEPGGLRLHALFGGQPSIPGGTQALGQNASAMSLMFEHSGIYERTGVAIRYLNEGFLDRT